MDDQESSLQGFGHHALGRWWLIVVLMTLGGLVGSVFSFFRPPLYEAKAILMTPIESDCPCGSYYQRYRQEQLLSAVGAVLNSSEVLDSIATAARAHGYLVEITQLRDAMALEGKFYKWELRVKDRDPLRAAALANLWAEAAYTKLIEARTHAMKAEQIQAQIESWRACLPGYAPPTPMAEQETTFLFAWDENCALYSVEEIQKFIDDLSATLLNEQCQSQGLFLPITFSFAEKATVPERPSVYERGKLIFAGAAIGFVLSLWLMNIGKVSLWSLKK